MKHATLALNCCLAALLAIGPPARAAPRDISAEIGAHRAEFVAAKVYAVTSDFSTRMSRTEESVARGCYYAATGDDLTTLLDVLVTGTLKEAAPHTHGLDTYTVVYLTSRTGTTALALGREYIDQAIQGTYDHAVPFEARMGLAADLTAWEARHTLASPDGSSCTPLPLPTL